MTMTLTAPEAAPMDARETQAPASPFAAAAGADLMGEVVTWDVEHASVRYDHLLDAIAAAGLDRAHARPVPYSDAFRRGMRRLQTGTTIVRKIDEAPDEIRYQVTREEKAHDGSELVYSRDHVVTLVKADGSLICDDEAVRVRVAELVARERDWRNGQDISRVAFKTFEDRRRADVDLIPLRNKGGVYFVRREARGLVDKVDAFLAALGCTLNRYPIARSHDNRSVREAVAAKMAALVAEYDAAVADFGPDTLARTTLAAAERIETLRFKIESYSEYLAFERDGLLARLAESRVALARKLAEIEAARASG